MCRRELGLHACLPMAHCSSIRFVCDVSVYLEAATGRKGCVCVCLFVWVQAAITTCKL